jgi:hypothetical protein
MQEDQSLRPMWDLFPTSSGDGRRFEPHALHTSPALLQRLIDHPERRQLDQLLQERLVQPSDLHVASWFVVDRRGVQVAAAYLADSTTSQIGSNFAYRTYFHGGSEELASSEVATPPRHITGTHLSTVFQSTATQHWKVAISTPIWDENEIFLGVVALTVDLGSIVDFREFSPNLFTVLVDGREGDHHGVILEHPLLKSLIDSGRPIPSHFQRDYRVPLDGWPVDGLAHYEDPLSHDPLGSAYRRRWIAAQQRVTLSQPQSPNGAEIPTGLVVLVQEDYGSIEAPIQQLGQWLTRQGLWALATFAAVVALLWFAVLRLLRGGAQDLRLRPLWPVRASATEAGLETIQLPPRRRNES